MSTKKDWKLLRGIWISKEPVLPGIWQRKEGGHVVRLRAKDPATGKQKDICKALPQADLATALKWQQHEQARVRDGVALVLIPSVLFNVFAPSLFEEKVATGDIRSAAGRNKWLYTLPHLFKYFGDMFVDKIHISHVEEWRADMARLVLAGMYSPTTVNGWINILRVIMKAARRKFQLTHNAVDGVRLLDTSEQDTYTEEEPNSFLPEEVGPFLDKFLLLYPQHYAMFFLMLFTGLRPSSVRPLRRKGPESDVDWENGRLHVRRSHTQGEEVMKTTKQKRRYSIGLPEELMAVLRWHEETQLRTPEQKASDLLFPSDEGGFRTQKVLNQPIAEVAAELGITKHITQRALRRTYNDLARAAQVNDLVIRSVSGHLTPGMQAHYSTVNGGEQREALAKVIRLVDHRATVTGSALGANTSPNSAPGGEVSGEDSLAGGEVLKSGAL